MNRSFIWISLILTLSVAMPRQAVKIYAAGDSEKPCAVKNQESKSCAMECHRQHSDLPDKETPRSLSPCQQQTLICCKMPEDLTPSVSFYFQKTNFPEQQDYLAPDLQDIAKPPEYSFRLIQ